MFSFRRHAAAPLGPASYCNNDLCERHYNGIPPNQLGFGCYGCTEPPRYDDVPQSWKDQIALNRLPDLFDGATQVRHWEHGGKPVKPRCPVCKEPLDRHLFTPPWGVWSQSRGGKSALGASTYISLDTDLWRKTGISHQSLRDVGDYVPKVIQPFLQDGVIPEKTQPGQRHSLVVLFERLGWLSRKGTLTDVAGETFADLANPNKDTPELRLGRALMLHSKQAIFVANPEWSTGIGAGIRPDLWAAIRRCFNALQRHAGGELALRTDHEIEALPNRIETTLSGWSFPVRNFAGAGFQPLAAEIAALADARANQALVSHLSQLLMTTRQEMQNMPTLTKQIQDIIAFFNLWGARVDGKYEVHVAFTVSKSDLLDGLVPDYDQYLVDLGPSSSSGEWRRALGLVSRASERVLWETERQAVQLVKDNFHKSAFFFVSALGRDAVPVVRRGRPARPTAARVAGESAPWMSPGQDASQALPGAGPASSDDDLPWNLQKLVALGADGTRTPKPRNVLLPLLWLLAQGQ